ncbi:hypothetical protein [Streptomyces sp. NPDC053560]|uniref:hypothetical protein n=1 Tax=Streptomyces sp. NPDC053560 TaxID=3365711 RepID=UPI0037CDFEF5
MHDIGRYIQRLVAAFSPGLHVSDAICAFASRHPDVETDVVPVRWWEQVAPVRDGRAQVAYIRRPFTGAPEVETRLAAPADRREKLLRDFLEIATATLRRG